MYQLTDGSSNSEGVQTVKMGSRDLDLRGQSVHFFQCPHRSDLCCFCVRFIARTPCFILISFFNVGICQTKITAECQSRIHDDKLKRSVLSARQTLNGRLKIRLLWARGTFHAFPLRKFGMDGTHSEWLVFLFEKKKSKNLETHGVCSVL